ncbi:Fc receptor-like protein 3 [Rana temporaria]|uniref:Fc receptor-like protein 3 n=1 Tax=Rana temporaria TaxID=8407 RepID=UPI001AAD5E86|nr:Fc receptor-like protein 3 [Rana temporaria]
MAGIRFILLISFFTHRTKAADRPVVTLDPNWNRIFRKESISLICNVETSGQNNQMIYWYKNNWMQRGAGEIRKIYYAQDDDKGSYQCTYGESGKSDPVHLDISNDWLILQANYVYEGDTLLLRCHGWDSSFKDEAKFFKDNAVLFSKGPVFRKEKITTEATGRYRCERERCKIFNIYTKETAETLVTVYELFSDPALKLIELPVMEGDSMTLKCNTNLAPPKKNTKLHFAFYRDGENVGEIGVSDTYRVMSSQLEDSGKYTCEVRTASDTVRKNSKALSIEIQAIFSEPVLRLNQSHLTEGDIMNLKCETTLVPPNKNTELRFVFYKDGRPMQEFGVSDTYRVLSARIEDSGNYACEVQTANGAVKKRSKDALIRIKAAYGQTQMKLSAEEVVVGDNIILSCDSTMSTLPILYTFYHNDTSFSNITVHQKEAAVERVTIRSPSMAGLYFCISDNGIAKQKQLSNTVILLVVDPVSGVNIVLDKAGEDFEFGDSLTLKCSVERGSSLTFLWMHNGKVVKKNSRVYQFRDDGKVLYIYSLRYYHSGSYQCSVSKKVSNRTFFVISDIQKINVLQQSPVKESTFTVDDDDPPEQMSILWPLLGVLVLVVALSVVLFVYRHKVSSIVPWFRQQTNPVPSVKLNVDGDVCYSHIQINHVRGPTDNNRGGQEDYSVTYSAVKCSGTNMHGTQTLGHAQLYENFSSKEKIK